MNNYSGTTMKHLFDDMSDDLAGLDIETTPVARVHPFEAKGLGTAPFYCTQVVQSGGVPCAYCGTRIRNEYRVRSADGKISSVGSECVNKLAGDGYGELAGFKRVKSQFDRVARAAAKDRRLAADASVWRVQHEVEAAFMDKAAPGSFAANMVTALGRWGSLTQGQLDGVRRSMLGAVKLAEIQAQRQAERYEAIATAPVVDISRIELAFKTAKAKGLGYPKMHLSIFVFKPAKAGGANDGAIYVTHAQYDTYFGMVKDGKFIKRRECNDEIEKQILEACANPADAANTYGRLTGRCAICSRKLTAKESVDRAIGPICAANVGW